MFRAMKLDFRTHWFRHLMGLGLLTICLGHATHWHRIGLIERLDAMVYDAKIRMEASGTVDDRVVILDIDEKSLAAEGQWPWRRDRLAQLMDRLFDDYQVRTVAFDVVFAEPDDRGEGTLDAKFAKSLTNRNVILGHYLSSLEGGYSAGVLPPPVLPKGAFQGRPVAITLWSGYGGNLSVLQSNAAGGGYFNFLVDEDGTSRRVPLLAEYKGEYYESLSLAVVRSLLGNPPIQPGFAEGGEGYGGLEWLDVSGMKFPVDENVSALIPYRGPQGSFPYISATDVMKGRVAVEKLKDRIVLVGTTAPGLMDLRATPVAAAYPGVEAHANLIVGMLDDTLLRKPAYLLAVDALLMGAVGLFMIFGLSAMPLRATLTSLGVLAGVVLVNLLLWNEARTVMPVAATLLLALLLYALHMAWGYFVESRTKRLFTELFGQYVPPELVTEMAKNPEGYSMAGRKAELTILFSDVRDFTTLSEGLPPDALAALMNEYLGAMTAIVQKHRGTLDKYIGDAIMAFWGAPVDDPDQAGRAVTTALEMQAALQSLNERLKEKGWPALRIGIGINTGVVTVGDMGSPVRKAYTVMGDAVNLASRLEGVTKDFGVGVVIGAATRAKLNQDPRFSFRDLGSVKVKGRVETVDISEPCSQTHTHP